MDESTSLTDGFARGTRLLRAGQCDAALVEFRAVYLAAVSSDRTDLMAATLCEMAWACFRLGQPEPGLECAMGARFLREKLAEPGELSRAMAVESILLLDLGEADAAYDLAITALTTAEQGGDAAVRAFALNALGIATVICHEAELGSSLLEQAVYLASDLGNPAAEAYYRLNLGFAFFKLAEDIADQDPDTATRHRETGIGHTAAAASLAAEAGDGWTLRAALVNGAEVLALLGRIDAALARLARSAELRDDPGASLRIHYLYTLGVVLQRSGDLGAARQACSDALRLADETNQIDHQVNAARHLAEIHEALGDEAAALAMQKRYHALYVRQSGESARRRARVEEIRSETARLRQRAAILASQALSDPLTGIANRRSFDSMLNRLAGTPIALAVLDLDHFKTVNDRYSHITGDVVLQRIARIIVDQLGPHGHCARLGGEEFALIFPNASELTAAALCEGIRAAVAGADWSDLAPDLGVTVSIGLAIGTGDQPSADLLQLADTRLYAAKAAGRDRVSTNHGALLVVAGDESRWRA